MAEEDLTLRMRAVGGRLAAEEIDQVSDALRHTDERGKTANKRLDRFQTKMAGMVTPITVAVAALTLFSPAILSAVSGLGLLAVAGVGAGAAFGALGLGVMTSLKPAIEQQKALTAAHDAYKQALLTGTPAQQSAALTNLNLLKQQAAAHQTNATRVVSAWRSVSSAMSKAVGPGVQPVLRGMRIFLGGLRQDVAGLKGPFLVLGHAVGNALGSVKTKQGMRDLVEGFGRLVKATAPLVGPMLSSLISFGRIFVNLATAAMPDLVRLMQKFSAWMSKIAGHTEDSAKLRRQIHHLVEVSRDLMGALGGVGKALWPLFTKGNTSQVLITLINGIATLTNGLVGLLLAMGPVGHAFATAMGAAFLLAKMSALKPVLLAVRWAIIMLANATGLSAAASRVGATAFWALNASLAANPIGLVVGLIIGLIAIVVLVATHFKWFKNAAVDAFHWLKQAGTDAFHWLKGAAKDSINFVIDLLNGLVKAFNATAGALAGALQISTS